MLEREHNYLGEHTAEGHKFGNPSNLDTIEGNRDYQRSGEGCVYHIVLLVTGPTLVSSTVLILFSSHIIDLSHQFLFIVVQFRKTE